MAKCLFVDDWDCPVEREEFPLEICKICVEARSVYESTTKLKVPGNGSDGGKEKEKLDISSMLAESSKEESDGGEEDHSREKLNKKFHEGELSVEEYIEKRKNSSRPNQK